MKNKKLYISVLALLLLTGFSGLKAQNDLDVGLKGGLNLAWLSADDANDNNIKPGFQLGLFSNLPVGSAFSVAPELLYTTKGHQVDYNSEFLGFDIAEGTTDFRFSYIEIPVMLKFFLAEDFNFHIGPYVGFLLNASTETDADVLEAINIDSEDELDKDYFNNTDFGFKAGLGFNFSNIHAGFNYSLGLVQVADQGDISEDLLNDAKHNVIEVYVGLGF